MRKTIVFMLFFVLPLLKSWAQSDDNYDWWNNRHNWDGVSSWSTYMTLEPGKMGPNALPVPELKNGSLDTTLSLLLAPEVHFAPNDFTSDLYFQLNVPLKKIVALQVWWVPLEFYKTDTVVRDLRAARTREAQGIATGDVYFGTVISIVRNKQNVPDITLSINLKTASGTRLNDARYTDTPGYFFDVTTGKDFKLNAVTDWKIRPYAMGGFYVYQTNRTDYFQNDAILWGVGAELKNESWCFKAQYTGYSGYFKNLDQPAVLRLEVNRFFKKSTALLRFQTGNESYPFTSIRAGMSWDLTPKSWR